MVRALPLVHNIETSVHSALPSSFQAFRAGFDLQAWRASGEFYYRVDRQKHTQYLDKWDACRKRAFFARHKQSGEVKVFSSACRLRWCSICANARRGFITHQVSDWIKKASYPKFLTVTLKHSDAPLAHQITSLYNYYRKFRLSKFFRDSVPGGIWFFQIKRSKNTGQWHPHIHCVIEGKYMRQSKLSKLWEQITYGSKVVDIRPVRNLDKGAAEVARYASTPADLTTNNPDDYVELFNSLHHRRSCGTWGTAKGVSLRQPKATDANDWENIGSWNVIHASQNKEPASMMIINAWRKGEPLAPGVTMAINERLFIDNGIKGILEKPQPYFPNFFHPT